MLLAAAPPACSPAAYVGGDVAAHVFVIVVCEARVAEVTVSAAGLHGATIRTSLAGRGRRCEGVGTVECRGPFAAGRAFRVDAKAGRPLRAGAPVRVVVSFADGQRDARRLTLLEPAGDRD